MNAGTPFPIAQLSFQGLSSINLAHAISDLSSVFESILPVSMSTKWDQDHLAVLEFGALRVVLCLGEDQDNMESNHLTMALVPRPEQDLTQVAVERLRATDTNRIRTIAEWLVSKVIERQRPSNVTWSTIRSNASVEDIEQMAEDLAHADEKRHRRAPLAHFYKPVSEIDVDAYLSRIPKRAKDSILQTPADSAFSLMRRALQYATMQSGVGQVDRAMAVVPIGIGLGAVVLGPTIEVDSEAHSVQAMVVTDTENPGLPFLSLNGLTEN